MLRSSIIRRFFAVWALLLVGTYIAGIFYAPDRHYREFDAQTLEHLTHKELGLPPHYWAYLQHSWEWSDLYDPQRAREALTASIRTNEKSSLYNMAVAVFEQDTCDVIDMPPRHHTVIEAYLRAEFLDLAAYEFLRWLCLGEGLKFTYEVESILESAYFGVPDLKPLLFVLYLEHVIQNMEGYDDEDIEFNRNINENIAFNIFILKYHGRLFLYSKRIFPNLNRLYDRFNSSEIEKLFDFHWDEKVQKKFRYSRRYGPLIERYSIISQNLAQHHMRGFDQISDYSSTYCLWSYEGADEAGLCMRRASFDHFSCFALLLGQRERYLPEYAACRQRYLEHFALPK